jgi:hypothetical protein
MKYIYQLTYLLFALDGVGRLFWKDFFFSNTNLVLFFVLAASALVSYCLFHSIFKQSSSSESARKQRVHTGFLTFIFVYSLTAPAVVALVFSSTLANLEEISLNDDLTPIEAYYSAYNKTHTKPIVELIYINSGLALPYLVDEDKWQLFIPNKQAANRRAEFLSQSKESKNIKSYFHNTVRINLILLLLKIGIALSILLVMAYIQRGRRKQ